MTRLWVLKHIPQNLANTIAENNLARLCLPLNHAYSDTVLIGIQIISSGEEESNNAAFMDEIVHQMSKYVLGYFQKKSRGSKTLKSLLNMKAI